MTRDEYELDICSRCGAAIDVPFKSDASIGDWKPKVADCHANVDYWVAHHPEYAPVRGWLCYASFGPDSLGYTAHSVVRGPDGKLIDITPVEDRNFLRRWFIKHLGDEETFVAMRKDTFITLTCQGDRPAPPLEPDWGAENYVFPQEEGL